MKLIKLTFTMLTILMIVFAAESFAQRGRNWRDSSGWGMNSNYRMYDPKTEETIVGEVISIDKTSPSKRMSYGIHLMLKTEKETISVHLGPGWYIEKLDTKIELKDKVEIKGSRITFDGKPAIIAAEVKKGDDLLTLRNKIGIPVWSGWQRK